jgi:hypothetical protein
MLRTLNTAADLVRGAFNRMDALGESNTIAFLTSDNGFMWYEHKLRNKSVFTMTWSGPVVRPMAPSCRGRRDGTSTWF